MRPASGNSTLPEAPGVRGSPEQTGFFLLNSFLLECSRLTVLSPCPLNSKVNPLCVSLCLLSSGRPFRSRAESPVLYRRFSLLSTLCMLCADLVLSGQGHVFSAPPGPRAVLDKDESRGARFLSPPSSSNGRGVRPALWALFGGPEAEEPLRKSPEEAIHGTLTEGLASLQGSLESPGGGRGGSQPFLASHHSVSLPPPEEAHCFLPPPSEDFASRGNSTSVSLSLSPSHPSAD